jgi:hypothetical protein
MLSSFTKKARKTGPQITDVLRNHTRPMAPAALFGRPLITQRAFFHTGGVIVTGVKFFDQTFLFLEAAFPGIDAY